MERKTLSKEDVSRLLSDPSGAARAETAAKIAADFDQDTLSDSERKLVEEIFRIMVKDAEVRVREALSQNLKENSAVPHDVALSLANDVDSVAMPVLEFSEVLSDQDLLEIVRSQNASKQVAIASRSTVSKDLSEALVETRNEDVVISLVANEGADISEKSFQKVVDEFGENDSVQGVLVDRSRIPVTVAERLVTMVSDNMKEKLAQNSELPASIATDLILQSRERAIINLSSGHNDDDLEKLVHHMRQNDRLTPSIIIRALCMGDLSFFEASLAELIALPLVNVRQLIHDSGQLGLKAIYEKANLPESHYPAVRAAVDVAGEMEYDGEANDRERYSRRMIERILTQYGDLGVEFEADDLEYLLGKMNELPPDTLDVA